jgi:hypothetical protein
MPVGLCPLCGGEKEIVSSHLIPRSVYDLCRTPDKSPYSLSDEWQGYTDRQIQHHLLCPGCEDNLNKGGETWLMPLLAQYDGPFPFYDLLTRFPPDIVDGKAAGYAAVKNSDIQCDKLAHFAMGVFWKAAVHSWKGLRATPMIGLGPYEESVRAYLRGDSAFPECMALTIGVLPAPVKLIGFELPHRGGEREWHNFLFYLPGIRFVLAVGKSLSKGVKATCFVRHTARPIVLMDFSPGIYKAASEVLLRPQKPKGPA